MSKKETHNTQKERRTEYKLNITEQYRNRNGNKNNYYTTTSV